MVTKHTRAEIAAMLAQASDMAAKGKLQNEIADTLGISVMTLHRWQHLRTRKRLIRANEFPSSSLRIRTCDAWSPICCSRK
jgi:orotate phosphoribosyltransferase-like protein